MREPTRVCTRSGSERALAGLRNRLLAHACSSQVDHLLTIHTLTVCARLSISYFGQVLHSTWSELSAVSAT
jgi:hypothetical protein